MKLINAFFRLIRWPNLVFIVLTQFLFYYCIILHSYNDYGMEHAWFLPVRAFWLLSASSVLIAAAGYIINDYFDLNIDQVNKPGSIIVQKIIKRRWAIFWHLGLSLAGVLITLYVTRRTGNWLVALINLLCVLLLWFYSTTFKRKFLIGNMVIALLTAWVVLVLYMSELDVITLTRNSVYQQVMKRVFKLAMLYGGFAFVISIIREVVKDMEDIAGDEKYGCRTMPIVWGIPASKVFTAVWLVVLTVAVLILQVYALMLGRFVAALYGILLVALPLVMILRNLYMATAPAQFHKISTWIKLVMLSGILSMLFFKIHL
jgi:4-hydroxybenzoate polyprenyltransferase